MENNAPINFAKVLGVLLLIVQEFMKMSGFQFGFGQGAIAWLPQMRHLLSMTGLALLLIAFGYQYSTARLNGAHFQVVIRVYGMYVFISLLAWFTMRQFLANQLSFDQAVSGVMRFNTSQYAQLFGMFLGLLLIAPLLNTLWQVRPNRNYHKLILMIMAILTVLPDAFASTFAIFPDYWVSTYPIGYYFVGLYFSTYRTDFVALPRLMTTFFSLMVVTGVSLLTINAGAREKTLPLYLPTILAVVLVLLLMVLGFRSLWFGRTLAFIGDASPWVILSSFAVNRLVLHFHYVGNEFVVLLIALITSFVIGLLVQFLMWLSRIGGTNGTNI